MQSYEVIRYIRPLGGRGAGEYGIKTPQDRGITLVIGVEHIAEDIKYTIQASVCSGEQFSKSKGKEVAKNSNPIFEGVLSKEQLNVGARTLRRAMFCLFGEKYTVMPIDKDMEVDKHLEDFLHFLSIDSLENSKETFISFEEGIKHLKRKV